MKTKNLPKPTIWVELKPMSYFIKSDMWDAELTPNGKGFNHCWTSERHDEIYPPGNEWYDFMPCGELYYELSQERPFMVDVEGDKFGVFALEQDGYVYFNRIHPDMIQTVLTKEDYPEYYL